MNAYIHTHNVCTGAEMVRSIDLGDGIYVCVCVCACACVCVYHTFTPQIKGKPVNIITYCTGSEKVNKIYAL